MAVAPSESRQADNRPEAATNGRDALDLFSAVRSGSLDAVRAQQAKGTPLDLVDENGRTALMSAAEEGLVDMVGTLVAEGCALGAKSLLGWTALTYAAFAGRDDVLRLLAARGLAVDERDVSSATPLAWAAAKGHAGAVRALLELGANVNARDTHGRTALAHCAGGVADVETLSLLLACACDVDAADVFGRTPLMVAVLANKPFAVDALIKAGADASRTDVHTPAILGPPSGPSAASMGLEADEAPAAPAAPVGKTALELAKERKHKHIERYLLAVGARTGPFEPYPPVVDQVLVRERMRAKIAKQEADGECAEPAGERDERRAAAARAADDDDIFTEIADEVADLTIRGDTAAGAEGELPDLSKIEDSLEDLD